MDWSLTRNFKELDGVILPEDRIPHYKFFHFEHKTFPYCWIFENHDKKFSVFEIVFWVDATKMNCSGKKKKRTKMHARKCD